MAVKLNFVLRNCYFAAAQILARYRYLTCPVNLWSGEGVVVKTRLERVNNEGGIENVGVWCQKKGQVNLEGL